MSKIKFRRAAAAVAALVLLAAASWLFFSPGEPVDQTGMSMTLAPAIPVEGQFTRAEGLREFSFPLDHGPHPDFQTEWWYYTGNLQTAGGRRFGYELTFFRRALTPQPKSADDGSDWRASQIYLAHFALSDIETQEFHYQENISRGAAGLAGAQGEPVFEVWLEDWSVQQIGNDRYALSANTEDYELELELTDLKGPILQGDRGYSQKGPETGNASYYISQSRLESNGKLRIGENVWDVSGSSWMDHEFSTSALSAGQMGWNWFAIQLDNGSELMLFTLQRNDGELDQIGRAHV
jgi:predicted secreted hydrolase